MFYGPDRLHRFDVCGPAVHRLVGWTAVFRHRLRPGAVLHLRPAARQQPQTAGGHADGGGKKGAGGHSGAAGHRHAHRQLDALRHHSLSGVPGHEAHSSPAVRSVRLFAVCGHQLSHRHGLRHRQHHGRGADDHRPGLRRQPGHHRRGHSLRHLRGRPVLPHVLLAAAALHPDRNGPLHQQPPHPAQLPGAAGAGRPVLSALLAGQPHAGRGFGHRRRPGRELLSQAGAAAAGGSDVSAVPVPGAHEKGHAGQHHRRLRGGAAGAGGLAAGSAPGACAGLPPARGYAGRQPDPRRRHFQHGQRLPSGAHLLRAGRHSGGHPRHRPL